MIQDHSKAITIAAIPIITTIEANGLYITINDTNVIKAVTLPNTIPIAFASDTIFITYPYRGGVETIVISNTIAQINSIICI